MTQSKSYLSQKAINEGTNSTFYPLFILYPLIVFIVGLIVFLVNYYQKSIITLILILSIYLVVQVYILPKIPRYFKSLRKKYLFRLLNYNNTIIIIMKEVIENVEKQILIEGNKNYKYTSFKKVVPEYFKILGNFPAGPIKQKTTDTIDTLIDNLVLIKDQLDFLKLSANNLEDVKILKLIKRLPPEITEEQFVFISEISKLAIPSRDIMDKLQKSLKYEREPLAIEIINVLSSNTF